MKDFVTSDMRIVLAGEVNVEKISHLKSEFIFSHPLNFTTHIVGGVLDLVLDNWQSDIVQWIPSLCSDHFVLCIQI